MRAFPNSRFIAIERVGALTGTAFATVREPLDGGLSILEAWTLDGGMSGTRTTTWSTGLQVQAIASGGLETAAIAGVNVSTNSLQSETVTMPTFGTMTSAVIESPRGTSRLVRLRWLSTTAFPMVALIDGASRSTARLVRPGAPGVFTLDVLAADGGTALGDDFVDTSNSTNRLALSGRCDGTCVFAGLTSGTVTSLTTRLGSLGYSPNTFGLTSPGTVFLPLSAAGFNATSSTRLAYDGTLFVYVAGQAGPNLGIERRNVESGTFERLFQSSGPLTLIDFIRSPNGMGVLALARVSSAGVQFDGASIPWTAGNQNNVVVIRIDASSSRVVTWDLPGDQNPVAFVSGPDVRLGIVLNEGSSAAFWRAPIP